MANDIKLNGIDTARQYSNAAGNAYNWLFKLITVLGIAQGSNLATAIQATDVIKLGILPAGLSIKDALIIVHDLFSDTSTFDIGFEYVDGVDDATVPEDSDYFAAAFDGHDTAIRSAATNTGVKPVTLPKDAYLIVTNNTAAQATGSELHIWVEGILTGHP